MWTHSRIQNISAENLGIQPFSRYGSRSHFLWLRLGIALSCIGWGCQALIANSGGESRVYRNAEYGFSMVLPAGWQRDEQLSAAIEAFVRREQKDAKGIAFLDPRHAEPEHFFLTIVFLEPDSRGQTKDWRRHRLDELSGQLTGRPEDHVYTSREVRLSGIPGVQFVACTAYEGQHGCEVTHHVTEVYAPQALIRMRFDIYSGSYRQYAKVIEAALATVRVEPTSPPLAAPRCVEQDIQVVEHGWEAGLTFSGRTDIDWQATLKNTAPHRCLVTVKYELLDERGQILFQEDYPIPESLGAGETAMVEMRQSGSLKTERIPSVVSSRVVISKLE